MNTIIETSQGIIFSHAIIVIYPTRIFDYEKQSFCALRVCLLGSEDIILEGEEASMFLKYFLEENKGENVVTIGRHSYIQQLIDQSTDTPPLTNTTKREE